MQHENDPAFALLYDFVGKDAPGVRVGAIMGLALAYAGTAKEEVWQWTDGLCLQLPHFSSQFNVSQKPKCGFVSFTCDILVCEML